MDKMGPISQTMVSDAISVNEKFCIMIQISLNFILKGPFDNNPVLVRSWHGAE